VVKLLLPHHPKRPKADPPVVHKNHGDELQPT
jgi:hypothetical protein